MARGYSYDDGWAPYVPVAQRRRQAERKAAELKKKGQATQPVVINGRGIASSFWGKAWCEHLEAYSDHANRLPRGRAYVRNGAVIDLQIDTGEVKALVSGSDIYRVAISVQPLQPARWQAIVKACAGQVASLIEVLQGRISKAVMTVVTHPATGLFPASKEMRLSCSCPDGARMCKHVAAALYGVGARLDHDPDLLFKLRHVSAIDLLSQGAQVPAEGLGGVGMNDGLADADLSALFGIDLGDGAAQSAVPAPPAAVAPKKPARKTAAKAPIETPIKGATKTATKKVAQTPTRTPTPAPAKAAAKQPATVSASELIDSGVPRHMIMAWLQAGVLVPSGQRGVYLQSRQTAARIKAYLARGTDS